MATPLVRPFVDDFEGPPAPVDAPIGTITRRDRFALVVPELWPWGLDLRYRMLQPRELKQAQGWKPSRASIQRSARSAGVTSSDSSL